jgi:hypothetical protein
LQLVATALGCGCCGNHQLGTAQHVAVQFAVKFRVAAAAGRTGSSFNASASVAAAVYIGYV